jgi:ATP-dependent exoDNAse (exonuclease V) alpha subunit
MKLTQEQQHIIEEILKFNRKIIKIGGFAGTGKTTVISELNKIIPDFAVCAFTGKAANVLRKKGLPASTIHSLIYVPAVDSAGKLILDDQNRPIFILNPNLKHNGIIIDEASMVSQDIYKDLCSFNVPLIFVGDHGQLEPIGENINLMANPDLKLETIHRNAGEIAHFAEHIRKGYRAASFVSSGKVQFISKWDVSYYLTSVDQIICAYNKTRVAINYKTRNQLGFESERPSIGDKLMCLRNNKQRGLFNGMQGYVDKLHKLPKNGMIFISDDFEYDVVFDPNQFYQEKHDFSHDRDDPDPFDYAYCITGHKSQGDEWDKVMVLEQKCKNWEHKRWAYTTASRAKEQVVWAEF